MTQITEKEKIENSKQKSRVVEVAVAHVEAWSNHDYEAARKSLASDVHVTVTTTQPTMSATDTTGIDEYMDGLIKFGQIVVPGSAHITDSIGDERNALLMVTVKAIIRQGMAPLPLTAARLYLLDEENRIKTEQVIFCVLMN